MGCSEPVRASRRALWALLSMRQLFDRIKKTPHPEEAAKRQSRRMHNADPGTPSGSPGPRVQARSLDPAFAGATILNEERGTDPTCHILERDVVVEVVDRGAGAGRRNGGGGGAGLVAETAA